MLLVLVGRGDPAVLVGVVDDGREEVDGLDDGQVLGQAVDAGIVVRLGADQKIGVGIRG